MISFATKATLAELVPQIAVEMAGARERGVVTQLIPALATVDSQRFGLCVATSDGQVYAGGDADMPFSIQSISKVFTLTLALRKVGDALWQRVGREPSGSAFNSIAQLEYEYGIPRNPFTNAGAIVVTDVLLSGCQPDGTLAEICGFLRATTADNSIDFDERVVRSEAENQGGFRNAALANYMRSFGNLVHDAQVTLKVYFQQCALAMTCRQLAQAGLYLADRGNHRAFEHSVVSPADARRINALMMLCGQYGGSGDFACRVGLPAKSGIGGGIVAIAPGVASIAVWSPGLNSHGNSVLGSLALERLAGLMNWSVLGR